MLYGPFGEDAYPMVPVHHHHCSGTCALVKGPRLIHTASRLSFSPLEDLTFGIAVGVHGVIRKADFVTLPRGVNDKVCREDQSTFYQGYHGSVFNIGSKWCTIVYSDVEKMI